MQCFTHKNNVHVNLFLPNDRFWTSWKHQQTFGDGDGDQQGKLERKGLINLSLRKMCFTRHYNLFSFIYLFICSVCLLVYLFICLFVFREMINSVNERNKAVSWMEYSPFSFSVFKYHLNQGQGWHIKWRSSAWCFKKQLLIFSNISESFWLSE